MYPCIFSRLCTNSSSYLVKSSKITYCVSQRFIIMHAIIVEKFGSEKQLKYVPDFSLPKPSNNSVLVKIIAAGINPVDTYIRAGAYAQLPDLPFIPGKDGAGIVSDIGENVAKFKVGDRVFVCNTSSSQQHGTYAQYSLAQENCVFTLPNTLTFLEGAALGIAYFTAYRALVILGKCHSGETVLVHGASGAVGIACVQIAKRLGLCVIGTAGTEEGMALVKSEGADHALCHKNRAYLEEILEITENKGVDIVIEMLANKNLSASISVLATHGRIGVVGCRGSTNFNPRDIMMGEKILFGVALNTSSEKEWSETASEIQKGIEEGWVKPVIDKTYPLSEAAQAHHDVIHNTGSKGKRVLIVQKE